MNDYVRSMRQYIGHETLIMVGASVVVYRGGKILLHKRSDNGCYGDFGGALEIGETVEETARREMFEETGLSANHLELVGVFSGKELLYTYPNGDKVANVCVSYLCTDFSGELKLSGESTELKWFDLHDLPSNISPPSKPIIEACVRRLKAGGL